MSSTASGLLRSTRALLSAARSAAKESISATPSKKVSAAAPKSPRKKASAGPVGIMALKPISPALQNFVGVKEISRVEAVKKIWAHIKLNNLQNPADKREIFCDDKLKAIFGGKDKVGFLEIAKLLSSHFVKAA